MGPVLTTNYPSLTTHTIKHCLTNYNNDVIPTLSRHEQPIQGAPNNQRSQSRVVLHQVPEDLSFVDTGEDKKGVKGCNFSTDEDIQLCKSWLSISEDPVTGTDQKASTFWAAVTQDYCKYQPNGDRTLRSL